MSDEPRPNPTATAIAEWLREVARAHRRHAQAEIALARSQAPLELGGSPVDPRALGAFAQGNLNQAQLLEVLAYQVEQRPWPTEGPALYVHHLHHGRAACGRPDVPGDWPPGHKWSDAWADVTCPGCLAARAAAPCAPTA